eukprot:6051397-Amphidinium_carterae.2
MIISLNQVLRLANVIHLIFHTNVSRCGNLSALELVRSLLNGQLHEAACNLDSGGILENKLTYLKPNSAMDYG